MPRMWKAIYVDNDMDARVLDSMWLDHLKVVWGVSSLEWDKDWEKVKDEETVECPVCHKTNDWDRMNCIACGANLRLETEIDEQRGEG